jgi:mono/diheme cytochrome c family protein
MGFPMFNMPFIGNPLLIAIDAVLHVILSHGIAIGGGAVIVLAELLGHRQQSPEWEHFGRRMIKPTTIIIAAVGAPTGVGIWFITSVIAPRAIGSLLRLFFWPWFIEWIVFTLELTFLLLYYFTWDRWTNARKRNHIALGVAWVGASALTAALITGILGFMLTSDGWPWYQRFAQAFFNPSYVPQLILRLGEATFLGCIYAVLWLMFSQQPKQFRQQALRVFGRVALAALVVVCFAGLWYLRSIPPVFKDTMLASTGIPWLVQNPRTLLLIDVVLAAVVIAFVMFAIARFSAIMKTAAIAASLAAILFVAQFEFLRESMRKPYVMPGYMYANQVLVKEQPHFVKAGLLENSYWYNYEAADLPPGKYLFMQNCSRCHAIGGFNDIRARVAGRSADGIYVILGNMNSMVPFMPPFSGSDRERRILADYLYELSNPNAASQKGSK